MFKYTHRHILYTILFLFFSLFNIFPTITHAQIISSSSSEQETKTQEPSNELKIFVAFENWKINEIQNGKLIKKCPKLGSDDWGIFIEKFDPDNPLFNRWGIGSHLQLLYADFNNDDIKDGLFVLQLDDCAQGNGYVGDPEKSVIIMSKMNDYISDDKILKDFYFQINKLANHDKLAYININYVYDNAFYGTFKDWKKDGSDTHPGPSIKKYFAYDFKNKKLYTSSSDNIDVLN